MEHYKILGIDKNASMEEVTRAYKSKVNQFKSEINDEKRANAFIKVFDQAYEAIKAEREQNQYNSDVNNYENAYSEQSLKNNSDNDECKNFEDDEEEYNDRKKGRRKSSKHSSRKKHKSNKKKSSNSNSKDGEKDRRYKHEKTSANNRDESSVVGTVIKMILKILATPVIIVLSIIIFLCEIISLISWVASKVIIVAAIAISAIHGYQIYMGQPVQYKIFAISAGALVISLFLPSIVKIIPSTLGRVNDGLKRFVFE